MKLGIIGSGTIVQEFLPKLMEMSGVEVIAVQGTPRSFEQVKELCAQNHVEHAVSSFEDLAALDIDTVYVAVPNFLHFMYCKMALEKGFHVIVEKPITSNVREAQYLAELAEKQGRFLFEAVTTPYLANFEKIQEWMERIGTVKLVQSQYSQYSRRYDAFRAGQVLPVFDPEKAGGALMDLNLYNLYMVMGLFGEPRSAKYYANIERNIDTSGILILQYDSFQALCMAAKDCRGVATTIIQGTDGCIKTAMPANIIGKVTLELNDGTREEFNEGDPSTRLIPEFRAFIRAINENDTDFWKKTMERSVSVSKVQTEARLDAGIVFPMDREGL